MNGGPSFDATAASDALVGLAIHAFAVGLATGTVT